MILLFSWYVFSSTRLKKNCTKNLFLIVLIFKYKPYKKKITKVINIINDSSLFLISLFLHIRLKKNWTKNLFLTINF